jgi:hypothetical protein
MGENDVKFTRFAQIYGNSIAHSVDGDYLPIALIEHERQVAAANPEKPPTRIAVYRLEFNMTPPGSKVTGVKRGACSVDKTGRSTPVPAGCTSRARIRLACTPYRFRWIASA